MRIAILSLYTDAHAPLNAITAPSKQRYADQWGYTFINHFGTLDESRPPSWSKILLIQKYLKDFDWIYWIDADAMIMNSAIRLETCLRNYDLIIAQERAKSHFGNFQLNAGSFFVRNRPWSHRFLDTVYRLDEFREHIYWDQAAIWHVLESDPDACNHVFIETEPKRFNSFGDFYGKGDFVFHAVSFSTDVELKESLLRNTLDDDDVIPRERQPEVTLLFLLNRSEETSKLLAEFAIPSVVETNLGGSDLSMRVVNATPSVMCQTRYGPEVANLLARIRTIRKMVREYEGAHLVFARPDTQFLRTNWKRFCLVQLGNSDGCFLETGAHRGELGDTFFIVRATAEVISFFESAAKFLENGIHSSDAPPANSFAELVEIVQPAEYGCVFRRFPGNEVTNTGTCPPGLEVFNLVAHSAECIPDLKGKRQALETTRDAYKHVLKSVMDLRIKE